jgi:alkyl sulfatase BDS1-like metallo-beta-lactamase superfamily hydrolase
MNLDFIFDYLGVRLNGDKAEGKVIVINWVFSDLGRRYVTTLDNCALTYLADRANDQADATLTLERAVLHRLMLGETPLLDAVQQGLVRVDGNLSTVAELFSLFDDFPPMFAIIEPRSEP